MTTTGSITASYRMASDTAVSRDKRWLRLEPEQVPASNRKASLADIAKMVSYARSGRSAMGWQLEKCRWASFAASGLLTITLKLYVWPSHADLDYSLSLSGAGELGPRKLIGLQRDRALGISGQQRVQLPWRLEGSAYWELGCVDEYSQPIGNQGLTVAGPVLELGADGCYGVARISGLAMGHEYEVVIRMQKMEVEHVQPIHGQDWTINADGNKISITREPEVRDMAKISDLKIKARATWIDEQDEAQTVEEDLPIPACVQNLLETCSDGRLRISGSIRDAGDGYWELFYDACYKGDIIGRRWHGSDE